MLEFILFLKTLIASPLVWFVMFMGTAVLQFYLAQRLHHHQAWYAFVPVLKWLQWFQMGRVPTIHIIGLIPLVFVALIPSFGPKNLELITQTVKVILILQLGIYLLYYWYKAAAEITVRAGERRSHSLWFLIPGLNIFILGRLAFKQTFWVMSEKEKTLIDKINNGIDGDHKLTTIKKFASKKGYEKADFEILADKALTVKNINLRVLTSEAKWVHWLNYAAGGLFLIITAWITVTVLSNFSIIFQRSTEVASVASEPAAVSPRTTSPKTTQAKVPTVPVKKTIPEKFVFVMEINAVTPLDDRVLLDGTIRKGGAISREAQRFYVLDKNFKLLDSVKVNSVSGLFGQFTVDLAPFAAVENAAYLAETKLLREQNTLIGNSEISDLNQSVMIITDHDDAGQSQNRELIVTLKRDKLYKTDRLNVFDKDYNRVNKAEIVYLIDPQKRSVEALEPSDNVELVLEFDNPYTNQGVYMSPQTDLELLKEYLNLLDL